MNWNAHGYSTVDKERIWKEFVKGEDNKRQVYDQFRPNVSEKTRDPDIKISPRGKKFLEKPIVAPTGDGGTYLTTTSAITSGSSTPRLPALSLKQLGMSASSSVGGGAASPPSQLNSPPTSGEQRYHTPRQPVPLSPAANKTNGYSPSNLGNTHNTHNATKPSNSLSTMRLVKASSHDVGNCFRTTAGEETARITSPLRQPIHSQGGHTLFDYARKKRRASIHGGRQQ